MTKQRIGNIGVLNLTKVNEKTIAGIESIENVGCIIYSRETAHLQSALKVQNVGASIEINGDYQTLTGETVLSRNYFQSLTTPVQLLTVGSITFDEKIEEADLEGKIDGLFVVGTVYAPAHLQGHIQSKVKHMTGMFEPYEGEKPRVINGKHELTNAYLESIQSSVKLTVNGKLKLDKHLSTESLNQKIENLTVNGILYFHESQESAVFGLPHTINGKSVKIPEGFTLLTSSQSYSARTLRRLNGAKLMTTNPIYFEKDVSRELLEQAIDQIQTTSIVVVDEDLEDLLYEKTNIEAEILSYEGQYVVIENEEKWDTEEYAFYDKPVTLIVAGKLIFEEDLSATELKTTIKNIDLLGTIVTETPEIKGIIKSLLRLNDGSVESADQPVDSRYDVANYGELSL
ncbi:hypothetical protein [Jeotgalibacillus salarius]|uniref:Uncharacterized protein n=1 Tax=Jeotgalibacillus salarius TaxID=546023 RepID=A0A4Y8LHR7_9BACL|nr:hypothetical protein [Jeotgalibacillus salarius]TFE00605.1 hypothetical protein E2626_11555 [Jeotgalibacillus salarius]